MINDNAKNAYQSRDHECHWPDCKVQVPSAMWGCKEHWFRLPKTLRDRIWAAYKPGQEERMDPSEEYLAVAKNIQVWIGMHLCMLREYGNALAKALESG